MLSPSPLCSLHPLCVLFFLATLSSSSLRALLRREHRKEDESIEGKKRA
jgi:hypothetical protein